MSARKSGNLIKGTAVKETARPFSQPHSTIVFYLVACVFLLTPLLRGCIIGAFLSIADYRDILQNQVESAVVIRLVLGPFTQIIKFRSVRSRDKCQAPPQ